jgi:hypothetical protein
VTAPISDPIIAPIAADLVLCLAEEIAKVPNPPTTDPRVVCLRPGDRIELLISTMEDECCAGLAWVRWTGMVPSRSAFPAADDTVSPCDVMRWAVTFELGAVRCSPTPDADALPTCDEWTDTTLNVYDDLAAIRRALCCYTVAHPYVLVLQGAGEPLMTEGGCVGVAMTVTIAADTCDCPRP